MADIDAVEKRVNFVTLGTDGAVIGKEYRLTNNLSRVNVTACSMAHAAYDSGIACSNPTGDIPLHTHVLFFSVVLSW